MELGDHIFTEVNAKTNLSKLDALTSHYWHFSTFLMDDLENDLEDQGIWQPYFT
jgi:hypothetical protein